MFSSSACNRVTLPLFLLARSLDSTRPVTLVNMMMVNEETFDFIDVVCLNRYFGWYASSGKIEEGIRERS